jgi:hypothetical protein
MRDMNFTERSDLATFDTDCILGINRMPFGTMTRERSNDRHFAHRREGFVQSRKAWCIKTIVVGNQKSHGVMCSDDSRPSLVQGRLKGSVKLRSQAG